MAFQWLLLLPLYSTTPHSLSRRRLNLTPNRQWFSQIRPIIRPKNRLNKRISRGTAPIVLVEIGMEDGPVLRPIGTLEERIVSRAIKPVASREDGLGELGPRVRAERVGARGEFHGAEFVGGSVARVRRIDDVRGSARREEAVGAFEDGGVLLLPVVLGCRDESGGAAFCGREEFRDPEGGPVWARGAVDRGVL